MVTLAHRRRHFQIDPDTKFLLHCNGTDESTDFIDDSSYELTVTANGGAQIDTAQYKLGGASGLLNGSSAYLSLASSAVWVTTTCTIEAWIRLASASGYQTIIGRYQDTGNRWIWMWNGTGWDLPGAASSISDPISPETWQINTWHHVAYVLSEGTGYLYRDGTEIGSIASSIANITGELWIGKYGYPGDARYFNGHIDEVRWSSSVRYPTDFTPQTTEFSKYK